MEAGGGGACADTPAEGMRGARRVTLGVRAHCIAMTGGSRVVRHEYTMRVYASRGHTCVAGRPCCPCSDRR